MCPINAAEFIARTNKGDIMQVIDVREVIEFATYNIGGTNIPLSALPAQMDQLGYNKNDEIVVICKIGMRSKTAVILLQQRGYQNARNLTGGLIGLQKSKQ